MGRDTLTEPIARRRLPDLSDNVDVQDGTTQIEIVETPSTPNLHGRVVREGEPVTPLVFKVWLLTKPEYEAPNEGFVAP